MHIARSSCNPLESRKRENTAYYSREKVFREKGRNFFPEFVSRMGRVKV